MRQFLIFTVMSIKLFFRSREAVIWNFLFPIALFIFYVTVFSGMYPGQVSKGRVVADHLAKILAITSMSGGLFSLAISVAVLKEKGILRRYRVTPVKPITLISGIIIRQYVMMLLISVILTILALVIYHAELGGSMVANFLAVSLGILVFSALGYFIAGISGSNQAAVGIANLLFMPMLFLSGSAVPAFLFPEWLKSLSKILPATHLTNLYQALLFRGQSLAENMTPVLILGAFGVAFVVLTIFTARWE